MSPQTRRGVFWLLWFSLIGTALSCTLSKPARTPAATTVSNSQPEKAPVNSVPVIHVFVALADNVNQGIVRVSASLGNGDNAATNLYWGAAFGIRTFFSKNIEWKLISVTQSARGIRVIGGN